TVPFAPVMREFLDVALACLPEEAEQYDRGGNVVRDLPRTARRVRGKELHVSPNTLRHTWATLLEETGLDRSLIAEMGGWTSTAMLDRVYGHRRPVASKALV
ncbi:phage integrase family protein, partial [Salmonella enterica subsp. enterica serovar Istanbul]|nr:phage integrase family protein [Salmonella enterica subsp. enterica serovar Istanbul]